MELRCVIFRFALSFFFFFFQKFFFSYLVDFSGPGKGGKKRGRRGRKKKKNWRGIFRVILASFTHRRVRGSTLSMPCEAQPLNAIINAKSAPQSLVFSPLLPLPTLGSLPSVVALSGSSGSGGDGSAHNGAGGTSARRNE